MEFPIVTSSRFQKLMIGLTGFGNDKPILLIVSFPGLPNTFSGGFFATQPAAIDSTPLSVRMARWRATPQRRKVRTGADVLFCIWWRFLPPPAPPHGEGCSARLSRRPASRMFPKSRPICRIREPSIKSFERPAFFLARTVLLAPCTCISLRPGFNDFWPLMGNFFRSPTRISVTRRKNQGGFHPLPHRPSRDGKGFELGGRYKIVPPEPVESPCP